MWFALLLGHYKVSGSRVYLGWDFVVWSYSTFDNKKLQLQITKPKPLDLDYVVWSYNTFDNKKLQLQTTKPKPLDYVVWSYSTFDNNKLQLPITKSKPLDSLTYTVCAGSFSLSDFLLCAIILNIT